MFDGDRRELLRGATNLGHPAKGYFYFTARAAHNSGAQPVSPLSTLMEVANRSCKWKIYFQIEKLYLVKIVTLKKNRIVRKEKSGKENPGKGEVEEAISVGAIRVWNNFIGRSWVVIFLQMHKEGSANCTRRSFVEGVSKGWVKVGGANRGVSEV